MTVFFPIVGRYGEAESTSYTAPTAATGWTNSTNAYTNNGAYATYTVVHASNSVALYVSGFGFGSVIESDYTIDGIQVQIDRKAQSADNLKDYSVYIGWKAPKVWTAKGDNKASASYWPASDGTVTYGSTSDTWNSGITVTNLTATDFGVQIVVHNDDDVADLIASIDSIQISVTYTAPAETINFAGNLSDSGGPYWRPPGETDILDEVGEGVWQDGYYTNNSKQHEDWIYINCTIPGASTVYLDWLNGTTWTNGTYAMSNTAGNYWEINTSGTIQTCEGYDYSFNINNSGSIIEWNKVGLNNATARRYVQLNCTHVDITSQPLYLYNAIPPYGWNDTLKDDRLDKDQAIAGTLNDTGYLNFDEPTDDITLLNCTDFVGCWFNEKVCPESFTLDNIYFSLWWATNTSELNGTDNGIGWKKIRIHEFTMSQWDETMVDEYETFSSNAVCNISYDNGLSLWSDSYHLEKKFLNVTNTNFTDNDIYEFYLSIQESESPYAYPSVISNRSFMSWIEFNVPSNDTLNALDTDGDGLSDWEELYVTYTSRFVADTDNDGMSDDDEITYSSDPNNWTDTAALPVLEITLPFPVANSQTVLTGIGNVSVIIDNSTYWNLSLYDNATHTLRAYAVNSSNTDDGVKYCDVSSALYYQFDKEFTWYVNVSDGSNWLNETYYFKTFNGSGFLYLDNITVLGDADLEQGLSYDSVRKYVYAVEFLTYNYANVSAYSTKNNTLTYITSTSVWYNKELTTLNYFTGISTENYIHIVGGVESPSPSTYIWSYSFDGLSFTELNNESLGLDVGTVRNMFVEKNSTKDRIYIPYTHAGDAKLYVYSFSGSDLVLEDTYPAIGSPPIFYRKCAKFGDYICLVNVSDVDYTNGSLDLITYNESGNYNFTYYSTHVGNYTDVKTDGHYFYAVSDTSLDIFSVNDADELVLEYSYIDSGMSVTSFDDKSFIGSSNGHMLSYLFEGGQFIEQQSIDMENNTGSIYEMNGKGSYLVVAGEEGGLHLYGYELLRVAPPVISLVYAGDPTKDAITRDGAVRYVNQSYNNQTFCNITANITVPDYRTMGRYFQTTDDNILIPSGNMTDGDDRYHEKNHSIIASKWECTYTGEYSQISGYLIGSGMSPPWVSYAVYTDDSNKPGTLLGYTQRDWPGSDVFSDVERDAGTLYYPPCTRIWFTGDIAYDGSGDAAESITLTEGTSYWLVMATNDSYGYSVYPEVYGSKPYNYSEDIYWLLGNELGDTCYVKTTPYNLSSDMNFSNISDVSGFAWSDAKGQNGESPHYACIYAIANETYNDISTVGIASAIVHWYDDDVNTDNYSMVDMGDGWWTYNITGLTSGNWYSFDITAFDELNDDVLYEHFRWKVEGQTERIEFQCGVPYEDDVDHQGYNTSSVLYRNESVLYLWNRTYGTDDWYGDDEHMEDALPHEQGVDGTADDTGGWASDFPDDTLQARHCLKFAGAWWDDNISVQDTISLDNVYVHMWGAGGVKWNTMRLHYGRMNTLYNFGWLMLTEVLGESWNYVELGTNASTRESIVDTNLPSVSDPSGVSNTLRLITQHINISQTIDNTVFDGSSIYNFFLGYDNNGSLAWTQESAMIVNNRSYLSFIIFNVPQDIYDGTDTTTDSDGDTLSDHYEMNVSFTHPFLEDTDGDGYNDNADSMPNDYREHIFSVSNPVPANNSGVNKDTTTELTIDITGDGSYDWSIECDNGDSNSSVGDTSGTKDMQIATPLVGGVSYTWYVNVTDGISIVNKTYYFTAVGWRSVQDWNLTISNSSGWFELIDWNITLSNGSSWYLISDWNLTLNNLSEWAVVSDWNLTLSNSSSWQSIVDWNLTLSDTSEFALLQDWNLTLSNTSEWYLLQDWNLTISNGSGWSEIIDWNLSLSNISAYNLVDDWNLTVSNSTAYLLVQDWNLTLSNISGWYELIDWNLTLNNDSDWSLISDWNLTVSDHSDFSVVDDWNITISNSSVYYVIIDWNLTISNITVFKSVELWNLTLSDDSEYMIVQDWNITISNTSVYATVDLWNITLSNLSDWNHIADWNISLSNLSGYHVVDLWNTTLSNTTVFSNVETWNLTLSNTTDYLNIADWNITLSNISGWFMVDTWNLTLSNSSTYGIIDLWNLTVGNTSSWMSVQDWNLTLSNISGYVSIEIWNITLSNITVWDWYLISDWNLTLSNSTVWGWNLIDDWNLTLSNTTIWDWYLVEQWNVTLSNNTEYGVVDLWNTTLINDTVWSVISDWNLSLSNTSDYISINDWNLTLSNITVWDWYTIIDWNLTLTNSSGWTGIADWNLTLSNASDYLLIDDWNITLGDISGWSGISDWNLTLSNFSVWEWYAIIDWNLTLSNTSGWHELSDWNLTLSNTTEWGWNLVDDWNLTVGNTSSYHMIADWNITIINISEYTIIDDWNLTLSNTTVLDWHGVDDWNLTIGNITSYTLIADWNITLKNTSVYLSIADWNLTISNTSEYDWHLIFDWNLTLSNTSQILSIDTWNLTLSNHTDVELIELWNLTLLNTSDEISIIDVFPENNSLYSSIQPTLYFTLRNPKGLLMNYTIYIGNSSGNCTELLSSAAGVSNGTYHHVNYFTASSYNTYYWWSVNVSDSSGSVNESFVFRPVRGVGQVVDTPDVGVGWLLFVVVGVCLFLYRKKRK